MRFVLRIYCDIAKYKMENVKCKMQEKSTLDGYKDEIIAVFDDLATGKSALWLIMRFATGNDVYCRVLQ